MKTAVILILLAVAGCAAPPTRETPGAFDAAQSGQVPPQVAGRFADCVADGFQRAHWMLTNVTSASQRRSDGYRVEASTGHTVLVSVDVLDSGAASLLESHLAKFIDTSGERRAFSDCLVRFAP